MNSLINKHKWIPFFFGSLLVVAGIMVIIFAIVDPSNISRWLSIVIATTLFAYSLALIITGIIALKKKYFDLGFIYASILIALGVIILFNYTLIGQFMTLFFATLLCTLGGIELGQGGIFIYYKRKKVLVILAFILGAILVACGVLAFIFRNDIQPIVYIVTGAILSLLGLFIVIYGTYKIREPLKDKDSKLNKKKPKTITAKVIDNDEPQDEMKVIVHKDN